MTFRLRGEYQDILKEELAARMDRRPGYSLRAFARDLGLAPSRVSEVINKKRGLSAEAADRICRRLGYAGTERALFLAMVEAAHGRQKGRRAQAANRVIELRRELEGHRATDLTKTKVAWYHAALVALPRVKGFKPDSGWAARRLGVTSFQIENALRRLRRLGFFETESWSSVEDVNPTQEGRPRRMFNLEADGWLKAIRNAVEGSASPSNYSSAAVYALGSNQFEEARAILARFEDEMARLAAREPTERKDRIIGLAVQLFGLDDPSQK